MKQSHEILRPKALGINAAAAYLGVSASYLRKRRATNDGPKSIRMSASLVLYEVSELDRWLATRADEAEKSAVIRETDAVA